MCRREVCRFIMKVSVLIFMVTVDFLVKSKHRQ